MVRLCVMVVLMRRLIMLVLSIWFGLSFLYLSSGIGLL